MNISNLEKGINANLERVINANVKNPGTNLDRVQQIKHQRDTDRKSVSQKAPILSTEYIGNRNSRFVSSDYISMSSEIFHSSSHTTQSSSSFKSSDDILTYLANHPDYQKTPSSELGAIVAIVASSLALAGGVALIVVSGGSATPGVVLGTSLLIGGGIAGGQNAISGIIHENFSWADFAKTIAINSVLTLITFGSGYAAGGLSGLALRGTNLTERAIKTIGTISGALVGSGARTGTYLVITRVEGKPVEAMELVLEGVMGAVEGGFAGYLGAKAFLRPNPALEEQLEQLIVERPNPALEEQLEQVVVEEVKAPKEISLDPLKYMDPDGRPLRTLFDKQTVIEIFPHPDIECDLGLIQGFHTIENGKTGGAGLVHILKQHPDVAKLLNFTEKEIEIALQEVDQVRSPMINKISEAFNEIVKTKPVRVREVFNKKGEITSINYVFKYEEKFIKISVSYKEWDFGTKNIIQANIIKERDANKMTAWSDYLTKKT